MKLEKIITLANRDVEIPFLAMERSLRATGCVLPIRVIPYNDDLFDLPNGSVWWEIPEITDWLVSNKCHPSMRKYQCLTEANYQYVDTDVCFLRNPEEILKPYSGFITSCGHWRDITHTCTQESLEIIKQKSTMWQNKVFNSGQFACDSIIYSISGLINSSEKPEFKNTCVKWPHNDQPGMNLLVIMSGVEIINLTLQPLRMESTWAGDYVNDYERFWNDENRKPYLIHWAGTKPGISGNKIDEIFFDHLTEYENNLWKKSLNNKARNNMICKFRNAVRKTYRALSELLI